jgi:DNA-binding MarR family transcriptional regulator
MLHHAIERLMVLYPRVLTACRARRVRVGSDDSVSDHQFQILSLLDASEPTSLKRLARQSGVTPSTMSLTADRLVRRGFIVRETDEDDRRRICLRLTPTGEEMVRSRSLLDEDRVARLLGRLPPGKRRQAIRGLSILARAAREMDEE